MRSILSAKNKIKHLRFALSFVNESTMSINSMQNYIHCEEKRFYLRRVENKVYLAPEEDTERNTGQSRRHITKLMFLAAIAHPVYDMEGKVVFNGMICIGSSTDFFSCYKAFKKSSSWHNRTKRNKCYETVVSRLNSGQMFPATRTKWYNRNTRAPKTQQDNAEVHSNESDSLF